MNYTNMLTILTAHLNLMRLRMLMWENIFTSVSQPFITKLNIQFFISFLC